MNARLIFREFKMFILKCILIPLMALFKNSAMHSQDMALNANYAKTVLFSLKWAWGGEGGEIRHRQAYSAHQVGSLPVQNMDLSDCKGSCQFGLAFPVKGCVICQCRFHLTVPHRGDALLPPN